MLGSQQIQIQRLQIHLPKLKIPKYDLKIPLQKLSFLGGGHQGISLGRVLFRGLFGVFADPCPNYVLRSFGGIMFRSDCTFFQGPAQEFTIVRNPITQPEGLDMDSKNPSATVVLLPSAILQTRWHQKKAAGLALEFHWVSPTPRPKLNNIRLSNLGWER